MTEDDLAIIPESLRTEENKELFDSSETFESFLTTTIEGTRNSKSLSEQIELLKKESENKISIPGEDSTDEERAALYKAIGAPETVEGYGIEVDPNTPGGKSLLESFLKAGLTKDQALSQMASFSEIDKAAKAETEAALKSNLEEFKKSLGDKAEETFTHAKKGIDAFFPDKEAKEKVSKQIMESPDLIKAYSKLGKLIQERPGILAFGGTGTRSKVVYETMKELDQ